MKTRKAKIMALMAAATLSIFSAGSVMAAGNGDFYPQPVNSDWEDAHTEGAYASFTNGSDYVNIYKYALDDAKIGVAKCNDTYEACYQTIFSEGNSLYMAVGYARDADDIGEVRKMVESISYPGNPTLTGKDGKGGSSDNGSSKDSSSTSSDKNTDGSSSSTDTTGGNSGSGSSDSSDSSKDSDILSTADLTLYDSEGNTVSVERTIYSDYSSKYVGDDGTVYTTDDEVYFTDENGKTWQALNDDTHYMGAELGQHVLEDADGNSVTVTETTNGDFYYRDDNGTGFTDNGDGTYNVDVPSDGSSLDTSAWCNSLRDFGPKYMNEDFYDKVSLPEDQGDGIKLADDAINEKYVDTEKNCGFPMVQYTDEDLSRITAIRTDIYKYVEAQYAHWVVDGGIDDEWDSYIDQLKAMDIDEFLQIQTDAYNAYKENLAK